MIKKSGGCVYRNVGDMTSHEFIIYGIVRGIKPKAILEIGIRSGVSTLAMCQAIEDGGMVVDYHCCDIKESCKKVQTKTSIPLQFCVMSSDRLAVHWNIPIDILFIDGSHEYRQVKRDYFHFSKFVRKNGFIFLHDTHPPSENYKSENYCGDAYKILEDLKSDASIEFVTFPYSFGLTVCRKLSEKHC